MTKIFITAAFFFFSGLATATSLTCQSKLMPEIFWYVDFNNTGAKIETPKSTQKFKWSHVSANVLTHESDEGNVRTTYVLNRVSGELTMTMTCLTSCAVNKPIVVDFDCKKSEKVERKF